MNEIWILGATGRTGRAIAARLGERQRSVVLVGRDRNRLEAVARDVGGEASVLVAASLADTTHRIAAGAPAVVVNTVGPFATTQPLIATAGPAGTHYLDLANDLPAVTSLLGGHEEAVAAARCLVTGAGFGVLGTESATLRVCDGRPAPTSVRVDALAAIGGGGAVGTAVAESLVDVLAGGGYRYRSGRLTRGPIGGDAERFELPDGRIVTTVGAPLAELVAAQRGSGAPEVVAASNELPSGRVARLALSLVAPLVRIPLFRRAAVRAVAGIEVKEDRSAGEPTTWARARATWADGSTRVAWLRAGEGMDFTAAVAAEVADRLASGAGRPGAYTPGALFGAELAEQAGGTFLVEDRLG